MKYKSTMTVACVFALLFSLGPPNSGLAAEPYHLGVNLPITVTGALYCKDGVDAINLAGDVIELDRFSGHEIFK